MNGKWTVMTDTIWVKVLEINARLDELKSAPETREKRNEVHRLESKRAWLLCPYVRD